MNKLSNTLIRTHFYILHFVYFDSPDFYCLRDTCTLISNGKRDGKKQIGVGLVFMKGDEFVAYLVVLLID